MNTSDISSLINGSSSSSPSGGLDLSSSLQSFMPFIIITTILSILLVIFYGFSLFSKWRVNHAIIEIRDILKEMQQQSAAPTAVPEQKPEATVVAPPDPEMSTNEAPPDAEAPQQNNLS